MSGSQGPSQTTEHTTVYLAEAPAHAARPRNVAIWIDRQTAVLQAFWSGPPQHIDGGQTGGPARAASGGWWAERIQAPRAGPLQWYLDAILARLAPEDEVLILGPDGRKQDLCQQIHARGGRCGHVVGVGYATDLTSAEVVVPVTHVLHATRTLPEGQVRGSAPHLLAESRGAELE